MREDSGNFTYTLQEPNHLSENDQIRSDDGALTVPLTQQFGVWLVL